jgi:lipoprotein NlpI
MFEKLLQFVESTKDAEVYKWWGMYLESQRRFDAALAAYKKA